MSRRRSAAAIAAAPPALLRRRSSASIAHCATPALLLIALLVLAPALASAAGILPPRSQAPDFSAKAVVGADIQTISLSKDLLKKDGWAVLLFFPLAFTFVCPTEIRELDALADEFAKVKTSVAALSVDSAFAHRAWNAAPREAGGLGGVTIPLVADVTKQIAKDYGVLVEDPNDELAGVSLRAAFVIDPKRRIRSVQVNDENAGRSMHELLRLVKAFQHADAHGEGCPASWEPGRATVVPTPEGSLKFFSQWAKGEA